MGAAAIEAACSLIDEGCDVYAIGAGPLTYSIAPDQIARYTVFSETFASLAASAEVRTGINIV